MRILPPNLTHLWAELLIDELLRGGARDAVISPGMRSAPLAWSCARLRAQFPDLRIWTVPDERSAAFFALGLAKASGRPPIVICTSGTAGAHYYPAVIEASVSRIPLLLLTADRPPELHGWGANQSIDQEALFGRYVDLSISLSCAEPTAVAFTHLRATAARAAARALCGSGPVHLNVPLREPLMPAVQPIPELESLPSELLEGRPERRPWIELRAPRKLPSAEALELFAERLRNAERPIFICGPRAPTKGAEKLVAWLERQRIPLLAEATSNLHRSIVHYEAVLRNPRNAEALRPDLIVRLGGRLATRVLQGFADSGAFTIQLHEGGDPVDPNHRASLIVDGLLPELAEPAELAALADLARSQVREEGRYLKTWQSLDAEVAQRFASLDSADRPLCEPSIARGVAWAVAKAMGHTPSAEVALAVGSSMPVRDLDAFAAIQPGTLETFASRGVAGIDGGIATAFGLAAKGRKTALLVGDTAFLHDLGSLLWGARLGLSLAIVVVNNGGGRIFSFLDGGVGREPGSPAEKSFDELLTMPLDFDLSYAAQLAGARYLQPGTVGELREGVTQALETGGIWLFDARVDGTQTVEVHRQLWAVAQGAPE